MDKIKHIVDYIKSYWADDDIIRVWNEYCSNECMDDYVHSNDEFFFKEMFDSPDDAVRAVCYGNYTYTDDYVVFNDYGNLDTFICWDSDNSPIDLGILAEYLVDNGDSDTPTIDSDTLLENFVEDFSNEYNKSEETVSDVVEKYIEEEDFDFLCEDWEDLVEIIKERLG